MASAIISVRLHGDGTRAECAENEPQAQSLHHVPPHIERVTGGQQTSPVAVVALQRPGLPPMNPAQVEKGLQRLQDSSHESPGQKPQNAS